MEIVYLGVGLAICVIIVYTYQDWFSKAFVDIKNWVASLVEPFENGNGVPDEEKLRKIVNNIVQNNKQFKDFALEVSKAGLDPKRYNVRAFGHLVLLRHQKGAGITKEDIRAKLTEYGI